MNDKPEDKLGREAEMVIMDLDGTMLEGQSQKLLLPFLLHRRIIKYRQFLFISLWFVAYRLRLVSDPRSVAAPLSVSSQGGRSWSSKAPGTNSFS